jgi:hypothetical protein
MRQFGHCLRGPSIPLAAQKASGHDHDHLGLRLVLEILTKFPFWGAAMAPPIQVGQEEGAQNHLHALSSFASE